MYPGMPGPQIIRPQGAAVGPSAGGVGQPDGMTASHPQMRPPFPMAPRVLNHTLVVGNGQGSLRLLQFSDELSHEDDSKSRASYWDGTIKEFFTAKAILKITLWKDSQQQEAKPFEIGTPILPRFFLVTTQSGVKSMSLGLDGVVERVQFAGFATVECKRATWTFRYTNGYTVVLKGPLTAHAIAIPVVPQHGQQMPVNNGFTIRFERLVFDAVSFEKMVQVDAISGSRVQDPQQQGQQHLVAMANQQDDAARYEEPKSVIERAILPGEPVNAFGIPQATMRCLELAESVSQMTDLIQFSRDQDLGPKEALVQYARKLRNEVRPSLQPRGPGHGPGDGGPDGPSGGGGGPGPGPGGAGSSAFDGNNGTNGANTANGANGAAPPSNSLYPNVPGPSTTQAQGNGPSTPQNTSQAADTPKQAAAQPGPSSQASSSTPSASTSTPAAAATPASGSATTTPHMAHATLKRKAPQRPEDGSPAVANADAPPAKRPARKRSTRTQGG
ncbi:hypothetical protein WOLCODRAFT_100784 [Wolfiporia cocos MD-104 SS10]|uniref:LIM-domain binding protein n=1 Tax=Wolfiporia cocos (strain MD-104) TaxID=742152 RepID=A0A2H3JH89_WOLCO|nr:hypothetical protein WOLCODRAFT_100784 [Wolfiporia cocos MD-104 SS10]